ncbi:MAG TPA: NAD(P)/FAD-dependent oxidoreductase [Acidimicrobiales bacterium]
MATDQGDEGQARTSPGPDRTLSEADWEFRSAELQPTGGDFDPEAVRARYLAQRDRRLVAGRSDIRDLDADVHFGDSRKDPFTPVTARQPVIEEVDAVILGGGIAGIVAGANLRKAGIEKIRIVDQAGGMGGTWYWNRYPGVMCDIESYIYLPMLEELEYVPTRRYAFGEEIRSHLNAIAVKFDLIRDALFHTRILRAEWHDEDGRWRIHTDRGDVLSAKYYVLAPGILNLMKLPAIPGMESFGGPSFHTARWDYEYTGGSANEPLDHLADKTVALIGTGATGIQCLAPLAESAKQVYVFQRTPSAIGVRGNRPTDPDFGKNLKPNWQRERMENFQAIILGRPVDTDLVDDGWTHHFALVRNPPRTEGMSSSDFYRSMEEIDFRVMEAHRQRVADTVADPTTAEILKPQYRYICKRPCFHDEYLPAFNRPNVTLIDCPAGIERISETGLEVDGQTFDVDCIIYGTGFEAELTPLPRRVHHAIVGRGGLDIESKWSEGAATLYGMLIRDFPNMFVMPAPGLQSVVTANYTHLAVIGGEFVGRMVGLLEQQGVEVFEVSADAEASWTGQVIDAFVDGSRVMSACTPSRINNEGHPEAVNPRSGNYKGGGGMGDFFAYRELLDGWLDEGSFEGLELTRPSSDS